MTMTILRSNLKSFTVDDKNYYDANGRKTTDKNKKEKTATTNWVGIAIRLDGILAMDVFVSSHLVVFVRGKWNAISIFCLVRFQTCFRYWVAKRKMNGEKNEKPINSMLQIHK